MGRRSAAAIRLLRQGLRVDELTSADTADLGHDRGHRILTVAPRRRRRAEQAAVLLPLRFLRLGQHPELPAERRRGQDGSGREPAGGWNFGGTRQPGGLFCRAPPAVRVEPDAARAAEPGGLGD
jgi:hypothetical protein